MFRYTAEGDWRTGWYETARITKKSDITALHSLPGLDGMVGTSATVPSLDSNGKVKAVWAVDFSLGTLVRMMDTLKDGLQGTLYYADSTGMLLAASGGQSKFEQTSVAAYDDNYVKNGHRLIVAKDGVDYDATEHHIIVEDLVVGIDAARCATYRWHHECHLDLCPTNVYAKYSMCCAMYITVCLYHACRHDDYRLSI